MARPIKYVRNEEQAKRIERLAIIGCNDNHIAAIEEMSEAQLQKMYAKELANGRAKGIGAVSQTLYQMALSGKNPAATFFYLKCRAKWREVHHVEHSGVDGEQLGFKIIVCDYTKQIEK